MEGIDIAILTIITLSSLFAMYRGLARELLGITAWIVAGFGGLYGFYYTRPIFKRWISNDTFADIAGFCSIALIILIIFTLINVSLCRRLHKTALSGLDRFLGFLFGIVRGVVFVILLYMLSGMLLSGKERTYEENSILIPYIAQYEKYFSFISETSFPDIMGLDEKDVPSSEQKTEKVEEKVKNEDKQPEDTSSLMEPDEIAQVLNEIL